MAEDLENNLPIENPGCPFFTKPRQHNYWIDTERRREYSDLNEVDTQGVPATLDLIYHETFALGLPLVFATNSDQSKLDEAVPKTPSYMKHM
jgi:hypothetical protein